MSLLKYDEKIARSIHNQLNRTGITENAVFPKEKEKENYCPKTLVDETLEYIDPTPNIYTLFVQFNEKFFWNVLLPVQVKWSPRMTSCAGICTFHPRNKECVIALSNPLLKLRPRKDLIETLLHEMIHAYLFLTNDNRDRDGHGPIFQSHMKRINKEAGTNITIYHTFHEEVRLYQQHWWRCNGPCQKRAPFFGTVRRSMNRAPGKNDFWWAGHQATCGGQFIKIKEPEKPQKKKGNNSKNGTTGIPKKSPEKSNILNWMKKSNNSTQNNNISKKPNQPHITNLSNKKNLSSIQTDLKKLGNSTNNVHGWGTGGPNSASSNNTFKTSDNSLNNSSKHPSLSFSGTLGGNGTGRSILLDKYASVTSLSTNSSLHKTDLSKTKKQLKNSDIKSCLENIRVAYVNCPSCNNSINEAKINDHLDECLESTKESEIITSSSNKKRKNEEEYSKSNKVFKNENSLNDIMCPLCNQNIKPEEFNKHLDNCLQNDFDEKADDISVHDSSSSSVNLHDSPHFCLICDKTLDPSETLNDHLEECVSSVFNGSEIDDVADISKTEKEQDLENYPCPVCMSLVSKFLMNTHLDSCLIKTK